jgi:hypothetical protein
MRLFQLTAGVVLHPAMNAAANNKTASDTILEARLVFMVLGMVVGVM